MTDASNSRFNAEAAAWDSNPDVHEATAGALKAILHRFPDLKKRKAAGYAASEGPDILEIGSGTGILSLEIAPYARSLLAVDAASGMIDALTLKLKDTSAPQNVEPLCIMLEDPEDPRLPAADHANESDAGHSGAGKANGGVQNGPRRKFDLVLSHLVLHHIPELEPLLATMHGCLKPGGYVALTDFEDFGPEARKFHPEAKMAGVERDGIKRDWFAGIIREAGFADVEVKVGWSMEKDVERWPGEWGQKKPERGCEKLVFPFLICVGRRS